MSEPKTVYRPIPCPRHDAEGMELWLEDMAAHGLHFEKDSFFMGLASFLKGEPKKVRYRLEPTEKQLSVLDTHVPESEQLEFAEKYGWEFAGTSGQDYYIFRSENPDAREMHTDAEVRAISLAKIKKRQTSNVFSMILTAVIYPIITMHGKLILYMIMPGPLFMACSALLILWLLIHRIQAVVCTSKLRKKILEGRESEARRFPKAKLYITERIACAAACVAWVIALATVIFGNLEGDNKILLENYEGTVPFITAQDLLPEGEFHREELWDDNCIIEWSNAFTPYNAEYNEYGVVTTGDGRDTGSLRLTYHVAANEFFAHEIAKAYRSKDGGRKGTEMLDAEALGVDYAYAYLHDMGLLIQDGCKVIHLTYNCYGEGAPSTEQWRQMIADSME
ncbi:MAG: DUF2812 domain-containing protein [Oscillospiraceae bacterium]|nr:DUF2812 domain-containing protein [Oscillospiraceae bacterium]